MGVVEALYENEVDCVACDKVNAITPRVKKRLDAEQTRSSTLQWNEHKL